jgi:hypothetical protein
LNIDGAPRGALFYFKRELMNMRNGWRGAMRRVAGVSEVVAAMKKQIPRGLMSARDDKQEEQPTAEEQQVLRLGRAPFRRDLAQDDADNFEVAAQAGDTQAAAGSEAARRTVPLPSILTQGAPTLMRAGVMPKPTPANLRRFAETPIARRAINTIKDRVAGMQWRIEPRRGRFVDSHISQTKGYAGHSEESPKTQAGGDGLSGADRARGTADPSTARSPRTAEDAVREEPGERFAQDDNRRERIAILTENFEQPNPDDSFRSMVEQVLEDVLVGGFGAIELDLTGDAQRPLVMWPVDGASIRIKSDWDGNPASPRYVQATGQFAPNAEITLADEELSYIRLNPRTHTPFGLGKLEVAFETIHEFLGAHRYAARLASNTVVQYALWLQNLSPQHHERLIRWWQDEIEGTGKVPILSVESKPEVLRFGAGTDADLRLQWQEFLIRIIADAFDLPPVALGLERDVNRNTATTMYDDAFRTAVVPVARLVAEHLTRDVISKRLGWSDLQFVFTDVDAPNELEQAQIQQILIGCGVLTVNEVRWMKGLPPLVAGGAQDVPAME